MSAVASALLGASLGPFLDPGLVHARAATLARLTGRATYARALDAVFDVGLGGARVVHIDRAPRVREIFAETIGEAALAPLAGPARAAASLRVIEALAHPALGAARAVMDLLLVRVALVAAPLFASEPRALGAVVAGPQPYLDGDDLASLLLHEAVHQSVYLHDLVDPLFPPGASAVAVTNPLLRTERPLPLAYHAVFVAHAVARFYSACARTLDAAAILESVEASARAILASDALTQAGRAHAEALLADLGASWARALARVPDASLRAHAGARPRSELALHST